MSHSTVDVYVTSMRDYLLGRPLTFLASARSRTRIPQTLDYFHRPACLADLCPLEFFENYHRVSRSAKHSDPPDDVKATATRLEFHEAHPLAVSHMCARYQHDRVAVIHYKRLANRQVLSQETNDPLVLQQRMEYAQIALVLCASYTCLEELTGYAAPTQIPDELWWRLFVEKLDNGGFTARGQLLLDCAQEWFSSPLCDDEDVLGGHGPLSERSSFDRDNLLDDGSDVNWDHIAEACALHLAATTPSKNLSLAKTLSQSIAPRVGIVPDRAADYKLPAEADLAAFVNENYYLTGASREFTLLCGHAKPVIENPVGLPSSDSPTVPVETLVTAMEAAAVCDLSMDQLMEQRELILASLSLEDLKVRLNKPTLAARPSIRDVSRLMLLGRDQSEAFGTLAATFLQRLISKYPHDEEQTAAAQAALLQLANSQQNVIMLGEAGTGVCACVCGVCVCIMCICVSVCMCMMYTCVCLLCVECARVCV